MVVLISQLTIGCTGIENVTLWNAARTDPKVAVVTEFWDRSLRGEDVSDLIAPFPEDSDDVDEPRSVEPKQDDGKVPMLSVVSKLDERKDISEWAAAIGRAGRKLVKVEVEHSTDKEATVSVTFSPDDSGLVKITNQMRLTNANGSWKIFSIMDYMLF